MPADVLSGTGRVGRAGGRLRKDQKKAAASYAIGKIPEGMDAY